MEKREANPTLTLKDIARQAGVSLATVDRVLHNRAGVRPDTVRRVKETIERNAFQPHVAAAELARGRARRFAFVMPSGPNLFMQQIQSLSRRDVDLAFGPSPCSRDGRYRRVQSCRSRGHP